ncbi:T9SS type B sorting domain-containing protein [Pontimicrobium aquaticum]|uniref:T9SS type B sorting domain-containing protein n=1 Tax=Pontimicrobium aquaticum TaxID=2565367 RepID=A0A4U0EMX6_9FLAO|nr:T9SS type B sorting domain-containing protein [Pontimicrobium aquaticum]TJY32850.1 T9SS type B sorting domain-containing protein [Pontimicrobium aquaticum]
MKYLSIFILFIISGITFGQNVQTDATTYTPQQLIEDILIDSNCIENVIVTNVIGGDFNNTDQSYGYFDATGTNFPFQRGIVLSTGRLTNVQGPNKSLSDNDAPNWIGDADLEYELQEQNTLNATVIEFEFTAVADRISFRYIFASEEYQENNPNTCQYSDLFGFLIRPTNQQQYTNIAVAPNTREPVKVTTVHPEIPNGYPATITLYNGAINIPQNSNYSYVWNTGETTPTINVNSIGTYTIMVTNQNNCSNSRTITVLPSNIATIDDIIIEEASTNNKITVLVSGKGDYEYSLNLEPYQDSNFFENVNPGVHTIYVRDKNGCGIVEQVISVLGFPKFFTPNADGFNDTWQLYGVNSQFNQGATVTIFNRYGKLIKSFDNNSIGWDGTFNGKLLPSSDYWFVAKLANGKEYRGHFALVR